MATTNRFALGLQKEAESKASPPATTTTAAKPTTTNRFALNVYNGVSSYDQYRQKQSAVNSVQTKPKAQAAIVEPATSGNLANSRVPSNITNNRSSLMDRAVTGAGNTTSQYDFAGTKKKLDDLENRIKVIQYDPSADTDISKQNELYALRQQFNNLQREYDAAEADKWYSRVGGEINEEVKGGNKDLWGNLTKAAELTDVDMAIRMAMNAPGVGAITTSVEDDLRKAKEALPDNVSEDWMEYARQANERKLYDETVQQAREMAKEKPGAASVMSVATNTMGGAGAVDVIGKKIGRAITGSDAPINYQSAAMIPSAVTEEIREAVSEDMSPFWSQVYNFGMSAADTAVGMALGKYGGSGLSKVYSAMRGASSASSTMRSAKERGASDGQAIVLGLINSAVEAYLESDSIENLLSAGKTAETAWEVIKSQFKQEFGEEFATYLTGTAADLLIMGDKNELATNFRNLKDNGLSEQDASKEAAKQWVKGLLLNSIGGGLSGGLFGSLEAASRFAVPNIVNKLSSKTSQNTNAATGSVMPQVQQETETAPVMQDQGVENVEAEPATAAMPQEPVENVAPMSATQKKWDSFLKKTKQSPSESAWTQFYSSLSEAEGAELFAMLDEQEKAGKIKWRSDGTPGAVMPADDHIDNRDYGSVGNPKVKSFQYNNPELQPFIREGLQALADDLDRSTPGERYYNGLDPNGVGSQGLWSGQKRHTTPEIAELKDTYNMSWEDLNKAWDDLWNDAGRENNADAKRLELVVDKILTEGHRTLGGMEIEPNQAYIDAKNKIAGARQTQQVDTEAEELPMYVGDTGAKPAMGAADSGFDPYSHASIEHGAIPPGENPARVVDVPKSMDGESNVMQTVRTIMEADATPDAAIPELEQAIVQGQFSKMAITDQAASEKAESTIKRVGYQQALADWRAEVRNGKVSKDSVAMGETLYNAAVNANDYKSAVKIAIELSTQVRSAAQALQAVRMLKKMSPAAQLYGVKQSVDNLQKTLIDKYGDKAPNLTVNEDLAAKFLEAETDADRKSAEEALYKDIAKQIPATFADKWNAWRYLSMLGNTRTHTRNILGNGLFAPVRSIKNKVGAVLESGAQAAGWINQGQRTKAFAAAGKDLMDVARADYQNVEQDIMRVGKYNSASNIIDENRKIFDNVVLETLRQGNSKALEAEDAFFAKSAYASSLASYLKAQGFTAEDFTGNGMTDKQKDAARAYAIKEAQKATYRDINSFSEAISSIGFKNPGNNKAKKFVNAAIEGVMPFKKTPANILVRGMEYSPAGLLKAITVDAAQVKNGKITAGEYMDRLASGLTGTGLFALGCFLSNMGLLVGGAPKDEDQADLEGRQPYALEIGGKSITLDWLAPEAMPVFMGVELMEAIREGGGDASMTDKVLSFIKGLSGPMLEMSMMSSLQDALEATEYADDKLLSFMANGALGYLKQALPTLFGQLERSLEGNVRKTTFTQEGDKYLNKDAQYMVGSVANKIPFLDYNQVPYIDAWGRTEDMGGTGERLFNNMLNPAYVSDIQETPVDKEIKRLEEVLGGNLAPSRADKVLTIDKEKIILTADEYVTYAQAKGQNDLTFRQNLIDSDAYANLDDVTKAKAMEKAKELANVLAIKEAGFEPVMSDWQKELVNADAKTITKTLIAKAAESQAGTAEGGKYAGYSDMLSKGTIDDQVAISMLPETTYAKYEKYAAEHNVTASDLLDALAYKNSDDAKAVTGNQKPQDRVKEYIDSHYSKRSVKRGIWYILYAESSLPNEWK